MDAIVLGLPEKEREKEGDKKMFQTFAFTIQSPSNGLRAINEKQGAFPSTTLREITFFVALRNPQIADELAKCFSTFAGSIVIKSNERNQQHGVIVHTRQVCTRTCLSMKACTTAEEER